MSNTARCWSNRFGFSYPEWKDLSWCQKVRLYVLQFFYLQGYNCFWLQDSARWTIRKLGFTEHRCECRRTSNPKKKCWCRVDMFLEGEKQIVEIKQGVNDKVKHFLSNREKKKK